MRQRMWFIYILASDSRVLCTGVTGDLRRRMFEHREHRPGSFTARYHIEHLVYYEIAHDPSAAIQREKQIKRWRRERRLRLIEAANPGWLDLARDW